ncbi:MbnP family protein [Lewinella cohaerens]|uniref:MbnP family protein n=1 Tax=Lewinella cohaerens TaxID=70995 RepID=UPI00035E574C|nr:MbnP family protein [Lewinella cohaerens]
MRQLFLLLLSASLVFSACDPDEEEARGSLDLTFKATYQDEPLVMFDQVYTYPDGSPLKFQLFNYYVSDITLIKDDNSEGVLLSEVELINYEEVYDNATAEQGIQLNFDDLEPGVYTGIKIGLGLTGELNATQPGDYAADHPLSQNFWSWARGYVFAKIEARADRDGDGQFSDPLTYHIGEDELFTTLTMSKPLIIQKDNPANMTFSVDVYDILSRDGNYLDISAQENTQDHTNNIAIYGWLWENLNNSFKLNN